MSGYALLVTLLPLSSAFIAVSQKADSFPYSAGFDIEQVAQVAEALPSHSWEYGTAAEALLELYNPEISIFGQSPFPAPTFFKEDVRALSYADSKIVIGTGQNALSDGDGAVGDPASLGVSAYLLGKTEKKYADAAQDQLDYVVGGAPRFWNGAISHRADVPELWADFVYMAPPFLAYYGAATNNATLLFEAARQCGFYRQILQANTTASYRGVWEHIIGANNQDLGLWSTGNAWAAAGMTRVLATLVKAPKALTADGGQKAIDQLTGWIKEIVEGAIGSPHESGLLRNYLNDLGSGHGYGEISGSSLLAAVAYRMAVLQPANFTQTHIAWADKIRTVLGGNDAHGDPHITKQGIVTPAINPLNWGDTTPFTTGSPEGQNFVVLMYTAWRDCINAKVCKKP